MPPRPPPTPPVLTVLCAVAALAAAWVAVAVEQVVRAAAGLAAGIPVAGFILDPERGYALAALPGATTGPGPLAWTAFAGTAGMVAGAVLFAAVVGAFRTSGWLRAFALEWFVVALVWAPTALAAAVVPGGAGPAADLYDRLGDPPAGRWAALGLALLLLALGAGAAARRAVAVGRAWMRSDGLEFRRRLVRVTAGWPSLAGLAYLCLAVGWVRGPWAAAWALAVLGALHGRTK